jgi:hypothetical protein
MHPGEEEIDAQLRDAILREPLDTAGLDARIRERMDRSRIQRGKWIAAFGVAAVVTLLIGGYWLLPNRSAMALCVDAARDHRIEVIEHQRRTWLTDPAAIDAMAARRGLSAPAEALAPPDYRISRGKLCRLGGQVFLHFVYSDGAHEFSLYLRDRVAGQPAVRADLGSANVALIESARFTALVVTAGSRRDAPDLARFASARL